MRSFLAVAFALAVCTSTVLSDASITNFPNAITLPASYDPTIASYWNGLKHRRRTNLACSLSGKACYLAYLDSSSEKIHVLSLNPRTFKPEGAAVAFAGHEAGGLVGFDDGFAILTIVSNGQQANQIPMRIATLIRYQGAKELWRTALNGPGVHPKEGLTMSPDLNGDLVFSEKSGLFGAYFVVTAYTGNAKGHFGDAFQYVTSNGKLADIPENSWWGCSHNTGIALEAADAPPFASVCTEDQGAIWLNTKTRGMGSDGVKIANAHVTNGIGDEATGGMSGSFSSLARFQNSPGYIFAYQSRGAMHLTPNKWMGTGYTQCSPRWLNRNVAIAIMTDKNTLKGPQATSQLGAVDADKQVIWLTSSTVNDHQNVRVATFSSNLALVSWDTLANAHCKPLPGACTGDYIGTSYQLVNSAGAKVGKEVVAKIGVSGDMVTIGGKICWPHVPTTWSLQTPKTENTPVNAISIACATASSI